MISFTLPVRLSNNNEGQSRHWSKAHKTRLMFDKALWAIMDSWPIDAPTYPQRVTITRILGKGERLWDADSVLRGSAKQLLDSLVCANYFVDDGPKYITEVIGRQDATQRSKGPAILVEIERV